MALKGYIALHRKILQSSVFEDSELLKMWLWCLLRANHKDTEAVHGQQVISLKRGQFITGRFTGAKELKLTPMKYRKRLELLEKLKQISLKTTNKFTIITVINYSFYQDDKKKVTNKQPTNNQQITTDKNVKNEKELLGDSNESQKLPLIENKEDMSWNKVSDDYEEGSIDLDGDGSVKEEKKKSTKKYPNAVVIRKLFQEILGLSPLDWNKNVTVLQACENLYTERGVEKVQNALEFYRENQDKPFCPSINSPTDLDRKYVQLSKFKHSL
jgi:hypothetical protein